MIPTSDCDLAVFGTVNIEQMPNMASYMVYLIGILSRAVVIWCFIPFSGSR